VLDLPYSRRRILTAHNRVVLGNQNPHVEDLRDQSLGDALRSGVLGKPVIALCAVPLLIPVSALIWAHERPSVRREAILDACSFPANTHQVTKTEKAPSYQALSWRRFALFCATSAFRLTTVRLQTSVGRAFALS
jgi:hypothetical protein